MVRLSATSIPVKKIGCMLFALALTMSTFLSVFVITTAEPASLQLLDDEAGESGGFCAEISNEQVKVGEKSYKTTPGTGNHDFWMIRTKLPRTADIRKITQNGTAGAIRFWVYVEKQADVVNWNGAQAQLGDDWDKNVYQWNNWADQVKADGWNEIVLPFAEVSAKKGTPNPQAILYFNLRLYNKAFPTTIFVDDIRVSADTTKPGKTPRDPDLLLDDEAGETGGFCAEISDEQVKVGEKSYKTTPGTGNHDLWMIRTALPCTADIRKITQDGTAGAIRFWVHVEKQADVVNWNGAQVQLGGGLDTDVYQWTNWADQVKADGWNEIVLPFAEVSAKKGTPDPQAITYLHLRMYNKAFPTTIFVDDIRVSADATKPGVPTIDPDLILSDEDGESGGTVAVISDEQVKVGEKAYKATPGIASHDFWMIRTGLARPMDLRATIQDGTAGAVRFWVHVDSKNDVLMNWNGSQLQLGENWDKNVYVWNGWQTQIIKDGWNEIVLPFAEAGKIGTPNPASITYINIRMENKTYATTVYLDDIRVSADATKPELPTIDPDLILSDEDGESGGTVAVISDDRAKVGDVSYKATPGIAGHDFWMIRTGLARPMDLRATIQDGTAGAVRFWVHVDSKNDVLMNWNGSQLQLGENWDKNVYVWSGWQTQIVKDGWNEIVLPFAEAGIKGTPNPANITYINIRMENKAYATTVYLDDIRVSDDATKPELPTIDPKQILSDETGESGGFCAVISDEQAKVGDVSYKATPGIGNHEMWMIRTGLARPMDIRATIQDGTAGAVSFWVYVDSKQQVIDNWNGSQLQLGENWDKNVYVWNGWQTQIKQNGWNRILLNFADASSKGTPDPANITYINIRMENKAYATTVYLDDIRITEETYRVNDQPTIPDAKMFQPFESTAGIVTDASLIQKIWLDSDEKKQGDYSMAFTTKKGSLTIQYFPTVPVNAEAYNCLEFDLYVPKTDFFEFANHSLELSSSGKMDVNEISWGLGDLQLDEGWNHIQLSFERSAFTKDWKNERDIDLTAINYLRFYALGASVYEGQELTWRIDNMVFSHNGLPPLADETYEIVNPTGLDVTLRASKDVLPSYGRFTVSKLDTASLPAPIRAAVAADSSALVLGMSFQKDNIEYFLDGDVTIQLNPNGAWKQEKTTYYIYRVDVNGSVELLGKQAAAVGTMSWKENRKFATYLLTKVELAQPGQPDDNQDPDEPAPPEDPEEPDDPGPGDDDPGIGDDPGDWYDPQGPDDPDPDDPQQPDEPDTPDEPDATDPTPEPPDPTDPQVPTQPGENDGPNGLLITLLVIAGVVVLGGAATAVTLLIRRKRAGGPHGGDTE